MKRIVPSVYHVADTWPNYEKLKKRIDQRYRHRSKGARVPEEIAFNRPIVPLLSITFLLGL